MKAQLYRIGIPTLLIGLMGAILLAGNFLLLCGFSPG
jgi:hypothetical protein